jgi:hypothetical protein
VSGEWLIRASSSLGSENQPLPWCLAGIGIPARHRLLKYSAEFRHLSRGESLYCDQGHMVPGGIPRMRLLPPTRLCPARFSELIETVVMVRRRGKPHRGVDPAPRHNKPLDPAAPLPDMPLAYASVTPGRRARHDSAAGGSVARSTDQKI